MYLQEIGGRQVPQMQLVKAPLEPQAKPVTNQPKSPNAWNWRKTGSRSRSVDGCQPGALGGN